MDGPKPGSRLQEEGSGVQAIVVRVGDGASPVLVAAAGFEVALGKRYVCAVCDSELLITKAGAAEVRCHDQSMALAQVKPLPSSD